jgi:hypothetical protein
MKAAIPQLNTTELELPEKEKGFGNRLGSHFYNALNYKRVKGKLRVRGILKPHYSEATKSFSPEQWKEIKAEEKKQTYEIKNKKVA